MDGDDYVLDFMQQFNAIVKEVSDGLEAHGISASPGRALRFIRGAVRQRFAIDKSLRDQLEQHRAFEKDVAVVQQ